MANLESPCKHERVILIDGKTSDARSVRVPHLGLEDQNGDVRFGELAHGDYMELELCLDCGLALNYCLMESPSDDELRELFERE